MKSLKNYFKLVNNLLIFVDNFKRLVELIFKKKKANKI